MARALPPCVQAVVAASMAVQASASIVLFHPIVLKVPHAVSVILLQNKISYLSPSRHLSCMTILLSQPHLTIERCTTLNPSTLMPIASDGDSHNCLAEISESGLPRPDLTDTPYPDSDITMFVDGSSKKNPDGTNATGFAVVTSTEVLVAKSLPRHLSAQAAELIALTEACNLAKDKIATIYTDSQYAFSTIHVFAQQWKNRGKVTSTGKDINHKDLILSLLEAVQLPKKVAICKCAAHTGKEDPVSLGNAKADRAAKAAATEEILSFETTPQYTDYDILGDMQNASPQ